MHRIWFLCAFFKMMLLGGKYSKKSGSKKKEQRKKNKKKSLKLYLSPHEIKLIEAFKEAISGPQIDPEVSLEDDRDDIIKSLKREIIFTETCIKYVDLSIQLEGAQTKKTFERLEETIKDMVEDDDSIIDIFWDNLDAKEKRNLVGLHEMLNIKRAWLTKYVEKFAEKYQKIPDAVFEIVEDNSIDSIEDFFLTDRQVNILNVFGERAENLSRMIISPLVIKCANYLRQCPVIMHLPLLIVIMSIATTRDDHIKNMFQTNTTEGSPDKKKRRGWENKIFNNMYKGADKADRVKYGTIHLTGEPEGVLSCHTYGGRSHLILNDDVKSRCTITSYDSSYEKVKDLGTFTHCNHIANDFFPHELKYLSDRMDGKVHMKHPFHKDSFYKEVQIHGELTFRRDVKKIMVDATGVGVVTMTKYMLQFFTIIGTSIPYEFIP